MFGTLIDAPSRSDLMESSHIRHHLAPPGTLLPRICGFQTLKMQVFYHYGTLTQIVLLIHSLNIDIFKPQVSPVQSTHDRTINIPGKARRAIMFVEGRKVNLVAQIH